MLPLLVKPASLATVWKMPRPPAPVSSRRQDPRIRVLKKDVFWSKRRAVMVHVVCASAALRGENWNGCLRPVNTAVVNLFLLFVFFKDKIKLKQSIEHKKECTLLFACQN